MLICNERCRRTQEREPAHIGRCPAIPRYQISRYFEIGPRQNWFIFRFRWRCSLWWSTDSCGKKFVYYILAIRLFLSLSVDLTSHFSNFVAFRQLQILNARTKYYEILPAHTKTPHNTTHKITNRYFEFKYHFSTLQKKFRLLLNKGVVNIGYCIHLKYSNQMITPLYNTPLFKVSLYHAKRYGDRWVNLEEAVVMASLEARIAALRWGLLKQFPFRFPDFSPLSKY